MLNNFTIKARLFLLISIMSVLAVLLSVMGLYGMKQANDGLQTVYLNRTIPLADLAEIKTRLLHNRTAVVTVFSFPEDMSVQHKKIEENVDVIITLWEGFMATNLTPEEKILTDKFMVAQKPFASALRRTIGMQKQGNIEEGKKFYFETVRSLFKPIAESIDSLIELQKSIAKQEYEDAQNRYKTILKISIGALVFGLAIAFSVGLIIVRRLTKSLGDVQNVAKAIASGNLNSSIVIEGNDEVTTLLKTMKTMQQQLLDRDTKDRQAATEMLYLKFALDSISSNIMVSDNDRKIVYLNLAVQTMLKEAQPRLQKVLPQFDADKVLGMNMDIFHTNSAHQKQLLEGLTSPFESNIVVAGYSFRLISSPIKDTRGERFGTIVEWHDRTNQIAFEEEVANIVYSGADCGDFSVKMKTHDKVGYNKTLAESLNQLFAVTEKSLSDVLRVVESLAKGDLTQTIDNDYVGAFAAVKAGVNATAENLKSLITEIKNTSTVIASASNEISAGNNDLSNRTQEQAASLQQTAASMEELSTAVQQNTENARQANQLAESASSTAKKGVKAVNDVVKTMTTINESSHKIVDIISAIDDIAFQTNILALNAAVEAARAGEQGKGFAVVAVEVRNLAQRAASAAGEIKRLISDSVENVSDGSKQVEQAGKTMEDIVGAIQNVTAIMTEISAASIQQNAGINQVHHAITQMDSVTQQNAALVEQSAAAAEALSDQTRNLANEMAHFKTR